MVKKRKLIRTIEGDDGSVKKREYNFVVNGWTEKPYVFLFFDELCLERLSSIRSAMAFRMLFQLLPYVKFNDGYIDTGGYVRDCLHQDIGIAYSEISRCLGLLVDAKILIKDGKRYSLNHDLMWRGSGKALQEKVEFVLPDNLKIKK